MTFCWTSHRFAGGALALDVANSVILRFDAEKSVDRFAVPEQIETFADAAIKLCAERDRFPALTAPAPTNRDTLLELRETIDRYFRGYIIDGKVMTAGWLICSLPADRHCGHFNGRKPRQCHGTFGADADCRTGPGPPENLRKLRLAFHRPQQEPQSHLVRHGGVRQSPEGGEALSAKKETAS